MVRSRREAGGVVAAYKTIAARAEAEIVEKKSHFIGQIAPVATEEEALAFIAEVKAAHRMARHNVYAYVLRGGRVRYTDDGEPAKTAGMPTLEAIQHAGLEDVAVVVTRYFGGILLGTGGLVRAYTDATKAAIEAADVVTVSVCVDIILEVPYSSVASLRRPARSLPRATSPRTSCSPSACSTAPSPPSWKSSPSSPAAKVKSS